MEEDNSLVNIFGTIIIFSFFSILIVFTSVLYLGTMNNYALYQLYNTSLDYVADGSIPANFITIIQSSEAGLAEFFPYLDILWLIAFIAMAFSSVMFSYFTKRENFFSTFTLAIFGLIIFTYIGSIFIQLTEWFRDNIFYVVFPTLTDSFQYFSWYLENLWIINLILISLCILANFIDIDFSRFYNRKQGDTVEEI